MDRYGPPVNAHACTPASAPLRATIRPPGSKSITNRALIVAALAEGTSVLAGALLADDTWLMIEALRTLGISITVDESTRVLEVTGSRGFLPAESANVYCGNAGTVMRFGTALCALGQGRYELDGSARMRRRPIGALVDALRTLQCPVEYGQEEGFPPLVLHARGLRGGKLDFHGLESSQFLSALLMVAPYAQGDLFIEASSLTPSLPYVEMSLKVMEAFGVIVVADFGRCLSSKGSAKEDAEGQSARTTAAIALPHRFIVETPQRYQARAYSIEPDASAATYFLAAAAVAGGSVTVEGIGSESIQGDAAFVDILELMGCNVDREPDHLTIHGPPAGVALRGIDVDLNAMPDTVLTLSVLALFADGPTTIRNVANLRVKESNRLSALRRELTKLGAEVEEREDGLTIHPPVRLQSATIDTYDDHRMAMSFALAGLRSEGVVIRNPDCCDKTFPGFFDCFDRMTTAPAA